MVPTETITAGDNWCGVLCVCMYVPEEDTGIRIEMADNYKTEQMCHLDH